MAHVTDLGFSMADLYAAVLNGDVRRQVHPEFEDLYIYNYTEDVQYRNRWNKITLACRGLIVNQQTGEIVARPWEKFFNFGQRDLEIEFNAPVEVTDKMDGSLGILYRQPDGDWAIATRGSFASEQAAHANTLLYSKYRDWLRNPLMEYAQFNTFLFEIVYPENRIVVNYGDMDDLVLLGSVNKQYGWYEGPVVSAGAINWPGPQTEVFDYATFGDAISAADRKGMEGIVIRSGSKLVKVKQADYVELHRIVTNLSPKTIWEMIGNGKTIDQICADIPDEFHSYVKDIGRDLLRQASDIILDSTVLYRTAVSLVGTDRKKFALWVAKHVNPEYKKYMFLILDKRDITPVVWQSIKPRGDVKSLVTDNG